MSVRKDSKRVSGDPGFEKARGLSSLRRCSASQIEEELKEKIADEMLRQAGASPAHPAHTERQQFRQVRSRWSVRLNCITDEMLSERPSQSFVDELKFLVKLTPLSDREKFFIRGWMLGWTQKETAERWMDQLGAQSRFTVCRVLKEAITKCRQNAPLSFEAASRHALYRKPMHRNESWRTSLCPHCREPFIRGFGDGIYCSMGCRSAMVHR